MCAREVREKRERRRGQPSCRPSSAGTLGTSAHAESGLSGSGRPWPSPNAIESAEKKWKRSVSTRNQAHPWPERRGRVVGVGNPDKSLDGWPANVAQPSKPQSRSSRTWRGIRGEQGGWGVAHWGEAIALAES